MQNIFTFLCTFVATCSSIAVSNGTISYDEDPADNGHYHVNTTATFSCNDEYYLDGDLSIICESSGNWNQQPVCRGTQT